MIMPVPVRMPASVLMPVIVVMPVAVSSSGGGRIAHDPQHGGRSLLRHLGHSAALAPATTSPRARPAARAVPVASDFQPRTLACQLLPTKERRWMRTGHGSY